MRFDTAFPVDIMHYILGIGRALVGLIFPFCECSRAMVVLRVLPGV
jgi:hypothetical protein